MASAKQTRILVSGNGIATQTLAYWLQRSHLNFHITVVERAPSFRDNGQGVDIRSLGVDIIRNMGVEAEIRAAVSNEEGWQFVYDDSTPFAVFLGSDNAMSPTSDIEISRGDLIKILANTVPDKFDVRYSTSILDLNEHQHGITVTFDSGKQEDFDIVVGADGSGSGVRRILHDKGQVHGVGKASPNGRYSLRSAIGLWSMPRSEGDTMMARTYHAIGGRTAHIRPASGGGMSVMVIMCNSERQEELHRVTKMSHADARAWFRAEFADMRWDQMPRILSSMDAAPDFYVQDLAQVFVDRWASARGRAVLIGDAASCPGPITGHGTTNALYTAYMLARALAGEVKTAAAAGRSPDWLNAAQAYERAARPYVANCQRSLPGTPDITNPKSAWGVAVFRTVLRTVSFVINNFGGALSRVAGWLPQGGGDQFKLHPWDL